MDVDQFDFTLPEALIAQTPLRNRSDSRLLVLDKRTGEVKDDLFTNILDYFQPGDCLVLNDTRVVPARLFGVKKETRAKIELLLLKQVDGNTWETLVKPGKRVKVGTEVVFGNNDLVGTCIKELAHGGRLIQFSYEGIFQEIIDKLGEMPLPPYIKKQLQDKERYQTVFAKHQGSAAAPTAGLHFTESILNKLKEKGVQIAYITLHVGLGTFRPVSVDKVEEHTMHAEFYQMTAQCATLLNRVKEQGGRIIAVGTTSCRTLETLAAKHDGMFAPSSGWTDIFIYPGYSFKGIDGLLTNFHLPKSTLVMLVSAFAGRENILQAYNHAIKENYRFFSFGDAMLIIERR